MKKRFIAASLAASMLLSLSVNAAEQTEESAAIYFTEDFESAEKGNLTALSGWSVYPQGNTINIISSPDGDGKCIEYIPVYGSSGGPYIQKTGMDISGNFVAEGSFYLKNHSGCTLNLFNMRTSGGNDTILLKIDKSGQLVDANNVVLKSEFPEGKFVKLAVAVNAENATYDVYFNNRKIKSAIGIADLKSFDIALFRIQIASISSGCSSRLYIDDLAVYSTGDGKPIRGKALSELKPAKVQNNLNDGFLYVMDAPKMLRRGYVMEFAEGTGLASKNIDGTPYIPLRYSVEMLERGSVTYDESRSAAVVKIGEKTMDAIPNENAVFSGDSMLIDAYAFAELAGKKIWFDEPSGLLFMSDRTDTIDYNSYFDLFTDVTADLIYERPSGEKIVSDVKTKNPNRAHPRILFDGDGLEKLKKQAVENKYMASRAAEVIETADKYLDIEPREYIKIGHRLLESSREVLKRVINLGLAYYLTGDTKYADRVWTEASYFCTKWPDWSNYHFLDTGEATAAAAIAYDWLYDYWTDDQRLILETAIVERGINGIMEDYLDILPRERASGVSPGWTGYQNNWSFVCSGGVGMGALAICDSKPEYEQICAQMLGIAIQEMEGTLKTYAPDGGFIEGTSYWDYASRYLAYITSSLIASTGNDYGYLKTPGLDSTAYFIFDMLGPGGTFNYSDSGAGNAITSTPLWYARVFGDADLQAMFVQKKQELGLSSATAYQELLWYSPELEGGSASDRTDSYYRQVETMAIKDSLSLDDGNYIALHAGENGISHYHMDCGTFIFDMNGKRFALDLGNGTYNESGGYFRYRYSAQGHNTWVINPDDSLTQSTTAFTEIKRFESNKYEGYAIADISDAYKGKLDSLQRGIYAAECKSVFVVQDELKSRMGAEAYWQMHTTADIQILDGGKQALLTIDDDQVLATLLTDNDAGFEIRESMPYDGTPYYAVSDSDAHTKKLVIHLTNVTDERVAVEFQHLFKGEPLPENHVEVKPLDEWELGEIKPEWTEEIPNLTEIKVNGELLEGFNPETKNYKMTIDGNLINDIKVTAEAESEAEVKVTYPESYPGSVLISVSRGLRRNIYSIRLMPKYDISMFKDAERLKVVGVEASHEPQPQNNKDNTLDGDYNTRWSVMGKNHIDFDLGDTRRVDYISLAYYNGDKRIAYFNIYTSVDGKDWSLRYEGETSGLTSEDEFYPVAAEEARYIRVQVCGTSESLSGWNSITEFKAFGK